MKDPAWKNGPEDQEIFPDEPEHKEPEDNQEWGSHAEDSLPLLQLMLENSAEAVKRMDKTNARRVGSITHCLNAY